MKLRIVAGSESIGGHGSAPGLNELLRTDRLLVQGDASVRLLESQGRVRGFLAGRILGLRTGTGAMSRVADPARELAASLTEDPFERLLDTLEGRFVLGRIGPDGSCEIACDRFGQIDLYYQQESGGAVLATGLDLLPRTQGSVKHDQLALAHAFSVYGYRPPKRHTFYDGVRRLGVREIARCGSAGCSVRTVPLRLTPTAPYGKRELREYADLFLDAIDLRSSRDGNVVYLSSGWDSTAILAGLVRLHGARKVRAVIGRMNFATRSGLINPFEIDRARAVADYYGVRLDVVELDYHRRGAELIERLQPLGRAQMLASMTYFNHSLLAEGAAAIGGAGEAVFAGEISDGAHNLGFSQFVTIFHPVLDFREYSDKMLGYTFGPTFLRQLQSGSHLDDPVYDLLRRRMADAAFDDVAPADGVARQLLSSFFLRSARFPLYSLSNTRVLTPAGRERYRAEMEASYLAEPAAALTPETLYATYLHLYNSFHWQGGTVSTLAYTAGEHGLSMNIPFWDSRLQEFLSGMPESWGRGLDLKPTKYPLKWALEHAIDYPLHLQVGPHSYQYDVDPSFNHSAEFIYASGLSEPLKDVVRRRDYRRVLSPDVFDVDRLDRLVEGWLAGTEVRGGDLSDLASLVLCSASGWYGAGA